MTHYPHQEAPADDEFGIAPHTDTSFLTLVAPNDVPGLSIRTQAGDWIDAPVVPDAFVVNGGQLLQRWTNDRLPGHAASRDQPQRRRALCAGLLLRQQHRLADCRRCRPRSAPTGRPSIRRPATPTT